MDRPRIKGVMMKSAVDDVASHLASGTIDEAELAAHLKPEDLELFDELVIPSLWYPVDSVPRLLKLLWRAEGGSWENFLLKRGEAAARRIFESGTYANLVATAESWGGNQLPKALVALARSFYDFMQWELVGSVDDDEFRIEVTGATDWPEPIRIMGEAFIQHLYSHALRCDVRVSSERVGFDRVIYHLSHARRVG